MRKPNRRDILRSAAGGATALLGAGRIAAAEPWPSKPLKILVPVPPGGPADALVRMLARNMEPRLNQPVIVENRPGAVGLLALQALAAAPADGHTLLQIHAGMVSGQVLMKRFDMLSGLSPISLAADFPIVMVVPATGPHKTLEQFRAAAAGSPAGTLSYGTLGVGSFEHLLIASLCNTLKIQATHVPYKGGAELVQALLGGQIDFAYLLTQLAQPYVGKGQMRALAVLAEGRNAALPETASFAELKVPARLMSYWAGICAPAATPEHVADRLHRIVVDSVQEANIKTWLGQGGSIPRSSESRAAFRKLIESDQSFMQRVVDDNQIKLV